MSSQSTSGTNNPALQKRPLMDVARDLVDLLVEHMDDYRPNAPKDAPPGWVERIERLWSEGYRQTSTGFNELLAYATMHYRTQAEFMVHGLSASLHEPANEGSPVAAWAMVGEMPHPSASATEWIEALAAQPGACRGIAASPITLPLGRESSFSSDKLPSAALARKRIAAHMSIANDLSLVTEDEIGAWLAHPDESVQMALLTCVPSAMSRTGQLLYRLTPALVASAIATGVKWSAPLEELYTRTWDAFNTSFERWKSALHEHRLAVASEAPDLEPFLGLGRVGANLLAEVAKRNRYMTRARIARIFKDRGDLAGETDHLNGNIIMAAAENPHIPMEDLTAALADHLDTVRHLALFPQAMFIALRYMSKRPEGVPADPRLLAHLNKGITKGMPADEVALLLAVPGVEENPIIAARIKRERSPDVLAVLAKNASPADFGRYFGRLLSSTARVWSEQKDKWAWPEDRDRCHVPVVDTLTAATPEQLAGVQPRVWAQAFQHPTSEVRLEAQLAMGRIAQAAGGKETERASEIQATSRPNQPASTAHR